MVLAFAFGAALLPLRSHISVSTAALLLVVPVVVGAVIGGFVAGGISVVAGFLVYDYAFVPPYKTLSVGNAQNWAALVVYVVVMLLIARIVDALERSRDDARHAHDVMRRVSEVSELLVGDQPVDRLLETIVVSAQRVFNVPGVSLLELEDGRLVVVASAGEELTSEELRQLDPLSGRPIRVGTTAGTSTELRTVALSSSGRAVGILAMRGVPIAATDSSLLNTFANDAALALERAQLREQALRSKLFEEADRFRRGLLGAVSHDLRTPLATMKVASSTLLSPPNPLSETDTHELHGLIDLETDRLTRLVTSLLDMTRIDAGVLVARPAPVSVRAVVDDTMTSLGPQLTDHSVEIDLPEHLPDVLVDRLLVGQVLANLIDNADHHAPPHTMITVAAETRGDQVAVSVADTGPGVPPIEREAIFDRYVRFDTGGRAGLGLTIARTFVEAHGQRIWVEDAPTGGARFVFTLAAASAVPRPVTDAEPTR